jgi:signal transduction histidine kinase
MIFVSLIDNIALLLAVCLLHGLVMSKAGHRRFLAQLLSGLVFSLATLVAMSRPVILSPGVVFDGRSIVISLAGMFGGPVATALTVVPATIHRLYRGGGGVVMGVCVVITSGLLGMLFFHLRQRRAYLTQPLYVYLFGLLVHVNMLFWTLTLPRDVMVSTFKTIWIPVIVIYPLATLLLGTLMANLEAKVASEKAIQTLNEELEHRVSQRTAQLEAKNKEIEEFSYSVSHDLRAPLRAISGFAQIITRRHRQNLNEEGRHYFDNIVQASQHMDRLIEDLLRLSRLGRAGVRSENVSLKELLEDIRVRYSSRIEAEHVVFSLPNDLPTIRSDATLVSVILTNLIENALTYRRAGTHHCVEVHCAKADATVTLGVTDNGIGIPAEFHEKIFALFQRLHNQDEYPGTGIGLALVKKAVDLLDGKIVVQSDLGRGSTFLVELPVQVL